MSADINNSKDRLFDIDPCGWASFSFGKISADGISYVCEPHFDLADALISVLTEGRAQVISFDHEGTLSEFCISTFGLVYIEEEKCSYQPIPYGEMLDFAKRFVNELEEDKEKWAIAWHAHPQDDAEEYREYIELIDDTISELREAIRVASAFKERPFNYQRKTFRDIENFGVKWKNLV